MSDTFQAITGLGAGGVYQSGNNLGYQTAEKIRQDLNVLAYAGVILDLGGSDDVGLLFDGSPADWQPVRGYRDYELQGNELGGMTLQAVVFTRLGAVGAGSPPPTVQWRLRNVTDSLTAATGTAHDETTIQRDVQTVTLQATAKTYRLELFCEDPTLDCFGYGYLRVRKVPA